MNNFRNGLLPLCIGLIIGFILQKVFLNDCDINIAILENYMKNRDISVTQNHEKGCKKCNNLMDLMTQNRRSVERYMNELTKQNDPGLIKVIRENFLESPQSGKLRNSHGLVKTMQAAKVLEILKNKTGGFFVESGSFDGETTSNTIYLEQKRNWSGLLIEMDPWLYLQTKGKNRKAVISNACLSPTTHPMKVQIEEANWATATRISYGSKQQKTNNPHTYCFPFYSFMLAMGKTEIDYFSLDIEGLELDVLKTIPFDKLNIRVLTMEYAHSKFGKKAYIDFMKEKGYKVYADLTQCNHYCRDFVFVKETLIN